MSKKIEIDKKILIDFIISHSKLNQEEYNRNPKYNNQHPSFIAEDEMMDEIEKLGLLPEIMQQMPAIIK